ncbi:MAG TPA: O-antigen ligase family protein [Saprospiraceae bacterium]|nr:O-antigen ligase family protein [Saprospiraceae bacterium]
MKIAEKLLSDRSIILLTLGLVLICIAGLFTRNFYFYLIPPLLFLLVSCLMQPDLILFFIAFFVPISINPSDVYDSTLSLSLPTEPLLMVCVALFVFSLMSRLKADFSVLLHPIALLIYFYFAWNFVCSFTSTEKVVSIKFMIAKIWFIVPAFFLGSYYFKDRALSIRFIALFLFTLGIVSYYNFFHLAGFDFEDKPSQWTMQPFFKDHTILGGILGMGIPLGFGMVRLTKNNLYFKLFWSVILIGMLICMLVTFSRAAWVSLVPALLLFLLFKFKVKYQTVIVLFGVLLIYGLININSIIATLEQNKVSSSDDLVENVESISNISSDPSNLERINRWSCAIAMGKAKPLFGFGPGTYMFHYAPFQLSANRTVISTNFGDVGNAHSEYLGPLAEAGILGMLIFIALLFMVFYFAFKVYYRAKEKQDRILISSVSCALIAYFSHGFLNNFLDTDKAAVLFWAMISMLVCYDVMQNEQAKTEDQKKLID